MKTIAHCLSTPGCSLDQTPVHVMFRLSSTAGIFLFVLSSLIAQPNPEDSPESPDGVVKLETFKVLSGYVNSITVATHEKRASGVIMEAIVAEDLGKLPDISIADSLARLPGLTTQRVNSRAQDIAIRGLSGDFSTALLNGRQQVSAGSGRAVQFDQYPAELLNGVVVYKTASPTVIGQGLAGTVDMQTVRPLTAKTRRFAVNTSYEWTGYNGLNPDMSDSGFRYSVNYIDQLANGKVGIAFGYAHADQPGEGKQANVWGYTPAPDGSSVIGGLSADVRSSKLKRDGYFAVVEYQPTKNVHSTLDIMYSKFNEDQRIRGIDTLLGWMGTLQPGYTAQDGLVTNGSFTSIYAPLHNNLVWRDDSITNIGWNLVLGDGNGWVGELDLSTSRASRKDNILTLYEGFGSSFAGPADTMRLTMSGDAGFTITPTLNYADASQVKLAMPLGWGSGYIPGGQLGYFKGPLSKDEIDQYRLSAKRDLSSSIFSRVQFGSAYTHRGKWERDNGPGGMAGFYLGLANGAATAPLPGKTVTADMSYIGIPGVTGFDARKALESGLYRYVANDWTGAVASIWDVDEQVWTNFAQVDIDTKLAGVPLKGNFGLQGIKTEQRANGFAANGPTVTPVSDRHDYWDFAPSLNLVFELKSQNLVRLSAARQIARQKMSNMRASTTYSFNEALAGSTSTVNSPWSGDSGNPKLEPWRANSFDLSLEHYFEKERGYFALAGFYKDLVSYTYVQSTLADFHGFPTNSLLTPAIFQGYRTIPKNGQGGSIRGVEATLSVNGSVLSDALSGFGVIVSGSYIESSIQPDLSDPAITVPGLSKQILSTTVYYEKNGFSIRASSRYRSAYRGDIATFGIPGEVFRTLQPETVYDAQVSYTFPKTTRFGGLAVILQGYNLTDTPLKATFGSKDTRLVQDYQSYGAQYSIGVSYKF